VHLPHEPNNLWVSVHFCPQYVIHFILQRKQILFLFGD